MYRAFIKRTFDIVASSIGLLLLCPVIFTVTLLLIFANRGRPFFFQPRPGKGERVFNIIKFKTMNDKKDVDGNLLPDAQRLTKLGSFVRKTSLDELPQLINVLKGDMSLIGPRPLRTYYLPLYSEIQRKRHNVRPGITGWAQVNGRNAISWTEKFKYDVYYVENISFSLDCLILLKTAMNVITSKDINASKDVTMERFNGSN
jgi:undecaprenyl phosphate N,N'-diacetylbacillosamine 1-phosphate transferase